MTGAVSFVVKIFTEASASVASMVVTALCSSNATNNCEQTCINNDGSYTCQCRTGYQLNSDEMTCVGKEKLSISTRMVA